MTSVLRDEHVTSDVIYIWCAWTVGNQGKYAQPFTLNEVQSQDSCMWTNGLESSWNYVHDTISTYVGVWKVASSIPGSEVNVYMNRCNGFGYKLSAKCPTFKMLTYVENLEFLNSKSILWSKHDTLIETLFLGSLAWLTFKRGWSGWWMRVVPCNNCDFRYESEGGKSICFCAMAATKASCLSVLHAHP